MIGRPAIHVVIGCLFCCLSFAPSQWVRANDADRSTAHVFVDAQGRRMAYRLFTPHPLEPGRRYPLVLGLHGAGHRGTHAPVTAEMRAFSSDEVQRSNPCFVLTPQCPGAWDAFELVEGVASPGVGYYGVAADGAYHSVSIPVGAHLNGSRSRINIVAQAQRKSPVSFSVRNIRFSRPGMPDVPVEVSPASIKPLDESNPAQLPMDNSRLSDDGRELHIHLTDRTMGGVAIILPAAIMIQPDTSIQLEMRTDMVGRRHLLLLDTTKITELKWVNQDWDNAKPHRLDPEIAWPLGNAVALVDQLSEQLPIDPTRVYVVGSSMGGFATWDLLARYPDRFAAAVPICGGAASDAVEHIAKTPTWAFHGARDGVVKPERSRLIVEQLKSIPSARVQYTEYPDVAHDAWTPALQTPELYTWLFAQRRTERP
ncbi:alpha/beta fold hydrolase [Oscillatoria amoena NRMC-F 0135]|nr:alpha/beta fold hydrolase [Oscillatoria amoena NRMC-F 0135]